MYVCVCVRACLVFVVVFFVCVGGDVTAYLYLITRGGKEQWNYMQFMCDVVNV